MFPNEDGGYLNGDNFRPRIWTPLLTAAKLSHHRIHDLRHTCSTLLYAAGADPKSVQEQLGHSRVSITLGVYTHGRPRVRRWRTLLDFGRVLGYLERHAGVAQLARAYACQA